MKQQDQHIEKLLPLYFEGKLTGEQVLAVEAWINASPDNRAIVENMADIYISADYLYVLENTDTEEAYKQVVRKYRHSQWKKVLDKVEKVAAILFIPLLFVTVIQLYKSLRVEPIPMMSYSTNPGMTAKLTLPDGTVVNLNSDSRIAYPEKFFGKTRDVSLSGEAYFAVSKDNRHPFVVSTPYKAKVKVYGTHFNLDASPDEGQVVTTLEEGSVSLSYLAVGGRWKEEEIEPGKQITYSASTRKATVSDAELDVVTSWKDGLLIFRNTPVREVLHMLSKRYGVVFNVRNNKVYSNSFTGTMSRQRLERVLEILSLSSNMHFRHINNNNDNEAPETIEVY